MRRTILSILLPLLAVGVPAAYFIWRAHRSPNIPDREQVSPDGRQVAILREVNRSTFNIDRNFDVGVRAANSTEIRWLFSSPDEGRPEGTEHFIWSSDSRHVLLLGRQFVTETGTLPNGEQMYLLIDTQTGQARCNATQSAAERFGVDDVRAAGVPLPAPPATASADANDCEDDASRKMQSKGGGRGIL